MRDERTVTVPKAKLLDTLRVNQRTHRDTFLRAQEKYRERVIAELDRRLADARAGGRIDLGFRLPEPVDYTGNYDTAIAMVEWEVGDTVTLSAGDFERYVLDQWEWAGVFATSTRAYVEGGL